MGMITALFCVIISSLCSANQEHSWYAVSVSDFPSDPSIGSTVVDFKLRCARIAFLDAKQKMFCYDSSTNACTFYRYPPAAGLYSCVSNCRQGSKTCYQKVPPPNVVSPEEADVGFNVEATNVYDAPSESWWEFPMLQGKVLEFTIESFDLTNCGCTCVSFEIQDLDTSLVLDSHLYCDNTIPTTIKVMSNRVKIVFKTDGSETLPGFKLLAKTIDSYYCTSGSTTTLSASPGEIHVSNVYDEAMTCIWALKMATGKVIKIDFIEFDLNSCCSCANIVINDAAFTTQPLAGGALCGTTLPENIPVTISNDVSITMTTDGSATLPGFRIQYEEMPEPPLYICSGNQVLTSSTGIIKPKAVSGYDDNMVCSWRLEAPPGSKIRLFFLWFDLEQGYDNVKSTDLVSSTILGGTSFTGSGYPKPMTSTGNEVLVDFSTDLSVTLSGFHLFYHFI